MVTMGVEGLLIQVATGIVASATVGGLRAFFSQQVDVVNRAVESTCSRFREVEGTEKALHKWILTDAFVGLFERVESGEPRLR